MLIAIGIMAGIATIIGCGLLVASRRVKQDETDPVAELHALLPQTQCAQCGYPGCRPYAEAVLSGEADINQCAPGGDATVSAIARLLGRSSTEINPAYGRYQPGRVAQIDEPTCIGCTLCIEACPVDAILGAQRYTHTVITSECTGCELCIAPCPVDCISMLPLRHSRQQVA